MRSAAFAIIVIVALGFVVLHRKAFFLEIEPLAVSDVPPCTGDHWQDDPADWDQLSPMRCI